MTTHVELVHRRKFECRMCRIDFISSVDMNMHMDREHQGRWKWGDPDVILEGDSYSESSSCESQETSFEDENGEVIHYVESHAEQKGEVSRI